ncbi:MAG: hypothetical protein GY696_20415 [Gammaproteobacteria bacterium]|nr:hypothetical protein [Gammaproteobacteria bacterium]
MDDTTITLVSPDETTFDYTEEGTCQPPKIIAAIDEGIMTIPADSTLEEKPGEEETVGLPVMLSHSEYPESKPSGVTVGKPGIWAAPLTTIMDFWPQGWVRQTFTAASGSSVNETPLSAGMTDSIFESTHFKSCFLSLNEAPYVVRCARGSVSETCSTLWCVSANRGHAVHRIPHPAVSDQLCVPLHFVESMPLRLRSGSILPCRVLFDVDMRVWRESTPGRFVEKRVFSGKVLCDVRKKNGLTLRTHPNFFHVKLFECSTCVSATVLWANESVDCVAEWQSNFCALICGPSPAEIPLTDMLCLKPTCSTGIRDYVVSPTGFVLARLFFEDPPDEVNGVCLVPGSENPSSFVLTDLLYMDLQFYGLSSDFSPVYLTPLLSLSCVDVMNRVKRAHVAAESAIGLRNCQNMTIDFRDHFAKGTEINPVTTIGVTEQTFGCNLRPLGTALAPNTVYFVSRDWRMNNGPGQATIPAANFYSSDRVSHPSLNLPGEGREVLAGRINDGSMDDIFFNGRRVDQPWMGHGFQFLFNGIQWDLKCNGSV